MERSSSFDRVASALTPITVVPTSSTMQFLGNSSGSIASCWKLDKGR